MMGVGLWLMPWEAITGFIVAMTILKMTQNIFYTTISGFATLFGMLYILDGNIDYIPYILIGFLIIVIASIPEVIKTIQAPGGIKAYFENPNKVYEENKPKNE